MIIIINRTLLFIVGLTLLAACESLDEQVISYKKLDDGSVLRFDLDQEIIHSDNSDYDMGLEKICINDADFFCIESAIMTLSVPRDFPQQDHTWEKSGYSYRVLREESHRRAYIKRNKVWRDDEKNHLKAIYNAELVNIDQELEDAWNEWDLMGGMDTQNVYVEALEVAQRLTQCYLQNLDREQESDYFIYDKKDGITMIVFQKKSYADNCEVVFSGEVLAYNLLSKKGLFSK